MWKEAEEYLSKDKYIGPLINKYGHCVIRPDKKKDYLATLVESIVNQQLSGKAADAIFNRINKGLKEISAESILNEKETSFRKWGLSRPKVKYLKDLATKVESKKLKIRSLDKLSDEEVMKELVAVKGIGIWTAKMFLMFSLARPDVFPQEDLGIRNSLKKLLSAKGRLSSGQKNTSKIDELSKFSERWKPYRTVASWYLWEILENK